MNSSDDEATEVEAPGWAAIDQRSVALYPGQTPHQFTSAAAYDPESSAPLPCITVWEVPASHGSPAHWHYVTYGLSELFEKASPIPDQSGFGFELTFRCPREPGETMPPAWPLQLLQGLGRYVLSGDGSFDTGHLVAADGLALPSASLAGFACTVDPGLGKIDTPHGTVLFLLLFGLLGDELEAMASFEPARTVGLLRTLFPMGVTTLGRPSMRTDAAQKAVFKRFEVGIDLSGDAV